MRYTDLIRNYLTDHAPNYGDTDIHSLLEHLWRSYTEYNPVDSDTICAQLRTLEPIFEALPFEKSNELFNIVFTLCAAYERSAFLEGLHVGARLILELDPSPGSAQ